MNKCRTFAPSKETKLNQLKKLDMATTADKIEQALSLMNSHDWYWMMSDSNSAHGYACGSMRAFVELVATIEDCTIVKALRDLWVATYNYVHATMWSSDDKAKTEFKTQETELMSIIRPTYTVAA